MHPTIFALKRAYLATRNALEAQLHGSGLTAAQLDVLKLLLRPGGGSPRPPDGLDQRAVQTALGITSATLTRLLAGMERRGLVSRTPNPADSRGKRVSATPKAEKVFRQLMAEGEAAFSARFLEGLSPEETLALTRLLERVAGNMGSVREVEAPR